MMRGRLGHISDNTEEQVHAFVEELRLLAPEIRITYIGTTPDFGQGVETDTGRLWDAYWRLWHREAKKLGLSPYGALS